MSETRDPRIVELTRELQPAQDSLVRFVAKILQILGRQVQAADIEDLISESYIKAAARLQHDPDLEVREYVPWFKAFLRNECLNTSRKRFRRGEQPLTHEMEHLFEDANALRYAQQLELRDLVSKLASESDAAILQRFANGYKSTEIAEEMGLDAAAVRQRKRRALERMRAHLTTGEENPS